MIIAVDLARRTATLDAPTEFTRFSVQVLGHEGEDLTPDALAFAVGDILAELGLGRPDGTDVLVTAAGVRHLAGAAATPEWEEGFSSMCAYAADKGWMDAHGAIRAHIELAP